MGRQAIVAGRFYDNEPAKLAEAVDGYLDCGESRQTDPTLLAMVPHAGYYFSGAVCGKTLAMANLAPTVLMLGPNHTGLGGRFALWTDGEWNFPGGSLALDTDLTDALLGAHEFIAADTSAHVAEHSLEVVVPFLHRLNPETTIAPMAIACRDYDDVKDVGIAIGRMLKDFGKPVSIVVSSDMSHYIQQDEARRLDQMALEAAVAVNPGALFSTVATNGISMCGVLPMTAGLFAAREMGATKGKLAAYATSGDVSGDYDQVVGYAGVLVS